MKDKPVSLLKLNVVLFFHYIMASESNNNPDSNNNNDTLPNSAPTAPVSVRLSRRLSPFRQFSAITLSALVLMFLSKLIGNGSDEIWFIAFTGMVFYVWANSVIGFFARQKALRYIGISWLYYILMSIVLIISARYLSLLSLGDLYEYRTLLIANLIFYIIATVVVSIMRGIAFFTGIEY